AVQPVRGHARKPGKTPACKTGPRSAISGAVPGCPGYAYFTKDLGTWLVCDPTADPRGSVATLESASSASQRAQARRHSLLRQGARHLQTQLWSTPAHRAWKRHPRVEQSNRYWRSCAVGEQPPKTVCGGVVCTKQRDNVHKIEQLEVLYPWHPW